MNPAPTPRTATEAAKLFHDTYERLAPLYGYTTRYDTRAFEPESANGQLMIATCAEVLAAKDREIEALNRAVTLNRNNWRIDSEEKDREIARLKDTLVACVEQRDRHWQSLKVETARAEKAEAELARCNELCSNEHGGTVSQSLAATISQLRAEVERLKQFFKDGRVDWDVLNGVIAKTVADAKDVYAENKRLGDALAAELENKERMTKALQFNADYWESAKASDAEGESLVESMRKLCRAAIDAARAGTANKAQP